VPWAVHLCLTYPSKFSERDNDVLRLVTTEHHVCMCQLRYRLLILCMVVCSEHTHEHDGAC
jgi:hypothetical protein